MQGNREFSSYYAEFQRYAAEVTLDEPSELAALNRGTAATHEKYLSFEGYQRTVPSTVGRESE